MCKGYIREELRAYRAAAFDRYHTPGHKGVLCDEDITELGQGGSLFPADTIERAQERTAALYGVHAVRYLLHGASLGIKAALYAFRGKKVLYAPGVHRAFTEGCELFGVQAVPVSRAGETDEGGTVYTCGCAHLPLPLTLDEAQAALNAHPDAAALFVTSPDYLGRAADRRLAQLCEAYGVALIADAAHGAHFAFAPELREYRMERRADIAVLSAHKTLGAYTQTALMTVQNPLLLPEAEHALALLGTTSPNYAALARLEESVLQAAQNEKEYARLRAFTERLRERIPLLSNTDYTRLCVAGGERTAKELIGYGCMPETVIEDYTVLLLTPFDAEEKLARLQAALTKIRY